MENNKQSMPRFDELGLEGKLLSSITRKQFQTPTPIQHQVIPSALKGKDLVGIAQTGTGKTLAFGIPMIQRLMETRGQGLILVPTRELALQVEQSLSAIAMPLGFRFATIIGGISQFAQEKALSKNPHIVIATPGRLDDLMKQRIFKLDRINIITLDEADRMLDIGFLPQIKRILEIAPKDRQTMLFSATMPKAISSLASAFMKMPLRIEIAPQGTASENVEQEVFVVTKKDKIRLLESILNQYKGEKVLIFSRTKYGAKAITASVKKLGFKAAEIHSNRSQAQRKVAMDGFAGGRFSVLVATDIAARGIDVKDIAVVVNYDLPDNSEDYVHRIGRTGRAGKFGKAISFVTPSEKADIRKIEKLIRKSLPILALPKLPGVAVQDENERRPMRFDGRGAKPLGRRNYSGKSNFGSSRNRQSSRDRSTSRDRFKKKSDFRDSSEKSNSDSKPLGRRNYSGKSNFGSSRNRQSSRDRSTSRDGQSSRDRFKKKSDFRDSSEKSNRGGRSAKGKSQGRSSSRGDRNFGGNKKFNKRRFSRSSGPKSSRGRYSR